MLFSSTLLLLNQEQNHITEQFSRHLIELQTCSSAVCSSVSRLHPCKGWERNHRKLQRWYTVSWGAFFKYTTLGKASLRSIIESNDSAYGFSQNSIFFPSCTEKLWPFLSQHEMAANCNMIQRWQLLNQSLRFTWKKELNSKVLPLALLPVNLEGISKVEFMVHKTNP